MTPTILFYNLENEKGRKLKLICLKLKIRMKIVKKAQYLQPVGFLAGIHGIEDNHTVYDGEGFVDEMLVMKDFDNRLLDTFLLEFKRGKLERVNLKAIITPENISWDSIKLHEELQQEHAAMHESKN